MSFRDPLAMLWVLPLAGLIVLLYMLRMKRQSVQVPAAFLWPQQTEDVRANALIQRPKFSWLLLIQLMILGLLAITLGGPQQKQSGLAGEITVFVIDNSASMGATDVRPTRFDEAKRIIGDAIRAAKSGDRIAVIEAGPTPRVVFPMQPDAVKQLPRLNALSHTDATVDVAESLRLAAALAGSASNARIVLVSDGVFPEIRNFSAGKSSFVFVPVGKSDTNLAIQTLGLNDASTGRQAFIGITNTGSNAGSGTITLLADGKVIDSEQITINSNKTWGKTVRIPLESKLISARLKTDDLLEADNQAFAVNRPGGSMRVLLVGKGNLFLERALVLDPRVTLDRATEVPQTELGSGPGGRYNLIVFDGVREVPVKAPATLNFGGEGSPIVNAGGAGQSPIPGLIEPVPLMEGVRFDGVYIQQIRKLTPKSGARVVAESSLGPLVVSSRRSIAVAFDVLESDFPLDPSFPIFIGNCLDALSGGNRTDTLDVRPGQPFNVPAASNLTLSGPDTNEKIEPKSGMARVRSLDRVGEYALKGEGVNLPVVAWMKGSPESRIAPKSTLDIQSGATQTARTPDRFADFFKPLILAALLLLGLEWWMFARKS